MQQAYSNLGITNVSVTATNNYIRFKPTIDQISYLDSFMDAKGVELFDAPLDYQILLEGDYYHDPSIPAEQPTGQYAIVPNVFTYPLNVQYETLAQIHIPKDNYTAVETEAERLAEAGSGGLTATNGGAVINSAQECQPGYHWDFAESACVPDNSSCPTGYHWNGSTCVADGGSGTPAPAPDAAVPAGYISEDETQSLPGLTASSTINPDNPYYRAPIRKATVVARRWFKTERVLTDDNGRFQFTKRFKHKVRINIKFKNDDAIVRSMRGIRLWQMLFPLKKTFGVFSGNKTGIDYNFKKWNNTVKAKGNRYWSGATVHNAVQEYKTFATAQGIGQPEGKIRILVTNLALHGQGSTPMFNKRFLNAFPAEFVTTFIAFDINPIAGGLAALTAVLKHEVDMTISFTGRDGSPYSDFSSDDLKTTAYHELTHAGHYRIMKGSWYNQFVDAEIAEIIANIKGNFSPYGRGTSNNSPIIALGESWAYHMGQFMADMRYGAQSSTAGEQFTSYSNSSLPGSGLNCHLIALENYDPNLNGYPFNWIPKGLYYDLLDTRNEVTTPVTDAVANYTNHQFFQAFNSGITSVEAYRANFIQQNAISPSTNVTNLFAQYHH